MARFIILIFLAVAALNARFVTPTNQHMICKTVDTIFESDEQISHGPLQGPPGIPGVKGQAGSSGSKGDRGLPGLVNHTEIEKSIQEKVNTEAAEMKSTILSLKNSIQTLQTENEKMREDIRMLNRTKVARGCKETDLFYGGYCFWFDTTDHTFSQAELKCRSRHSTVGYILDSAHYDMMLVKLRPAIPERYFNRGFWLGLRQDPTTGTVTKISDGLKAPYLKWRTDHIEPDRGSSDTNIYLIVDKDASSNKNGMGDLPPNGSAGVICQYKSL